MVQLPISTVPDGSGGISNDGDNVYAALVRHVMTTFSPVLVPNSITGSVFFGTQVVMRVSWDELTPHLNLFATESKKLMGKHSLPHKTVRTYNDRRCSSDISPSVIESTVYLVSR
jgi:hypothetical protein